MYLSHWLYPVTVLGPGNRLCLWMRGCMRSCPGCISPELRSRGRKEIPAGELTLLLNRILETEELDGVTISGGEPFEQEEELFQLCSGLRSEDILVYSGFTKQELFRRFPEKLERSGIGVLITGPYLDALNDGRPLIGSSNQEIICIRGELRQRYEAYLSGAERKLQYFADESGDVFFAGIPPRDGPIRRYVVDLD